MSSTQNTDSPRAPRAKQSKGANQVSPNNSGNKPPRRQKGNRAQNGNLANAQSNGTGARTPPVTNANALEPAFADSAVVSSEEMAIPTGPRNPKKHTLSQPSADRVFSPASVATSSLTDTELGPASVGTPAKIQGAYAGPTFHASPAPSALPVPKFLSKSVPAKTRAAPPTPPPEDESDSGSSPTPSPSRAPIPVPPRQQDSPLDMLFKAHRAEKARNGSGSPASVSFSSPNQPSTNGRHHVKQDSSSSLNTPFPFELDGDSRNAHTSPPPASPGYRSITAPGKIPQAGGPAKPNNDSGAINDLLNRLSMSQAQNKAASSTPPRTVEHMPSDPALRNHTPSPFHDGRSPFIRSSSGPATPNPAPHENPDFFYGNRNLSPMFNAVKSDNSKRSSGLRTEVTANSPLMPQSGFSQGPPGNVDTRELLGNLFNGPTSPRRGSAPQIQPAQQMMTAHPHWSLPNDSQQQTRSPQVRTPGRRQARPGSYHARPNLHLNQAASGTPSTSQKSSTPMSFVPSSVRAKPQAPTPKKAETDAATLEQNLKRMLNL
ncbi:hypothetical protein K458DRAFT_241191, partial [Lentithecium fluviatile CBS 122367]